MSCCDLVAIRLLINKSVVVSPLQGQARSPKSTHPLGLRYGLPIVCFRFVVKAPTHLPGHLAADEKYEPFMASKGIWQLRLVGILYWTLRWLWVLMSQRFHADVDYPHSSSKPWAFSLSRTQ